MAKCVWDNENGPRKCINCGYKIHIDITGPIDRECKKDILQSYNRCIDKSISTKKSVKPAPERILDLIKLMSKYLYNVKKKQPIEYEPQLEICRSCTHLGINGCTYQRDGCNAGPQTQWAKCIINKDCPILLTK